MVSIKRLSKVLRSAIALLPISFSFFGAVFHSAAMIVLLPVLLFISVALLPCARKHENIWMFLLVLASSIPVNIVLIRRIIEFIGSGSNFFIYSILRSTELYIMLLSLEEVVLGLITRLIWRRQCKINLFQI